MKTIKSSFKITAFFFSILIFFQGCTVYKSANITLDQAVDTNANVKIKTTENQTLRFNYIEHESDVYYGLKNSNNSWVKIPINEDNIDKIQVKDKSLSIVSNIAIPFLVVGGVFLIAVLNDPYLN